MVNQETKQIIDMIPSRDTNDLIEWFKKFPNVTLSTRDGSTIYNGALEMGFNNIVQVSDRFHILKNLTDDLINEIDRIYSPMTVENIMISYEERKELKERYDKTITDIENGVSINESCKTNQIGYYTFKKIKSMSESELKIYFSNKPSTRDKVKKKNRDKKKKIIEKVRELKEKGISISKIAKDLKINRMTVTKYLKDSYINKLLDPDKIKNFYSELDKYRSELVSMVLNKTTLKNIYLTLKDKGYKGSFSNIKMYVSKLKKNGNLTYDIKISKHKLETLLFYNRDEELFHRKYLMIIYDKYPIIKKLLELFKEFKSILLNIRKEKCLAIWIDKAKALTNKYNLEYLPSFISGIERDIKAVNAALSNSYSNGILESKVNTVKLTKRIMYGRSDFSLIRNKAMRLEKLRKCQ